MARTILVFSDGPGRGKTTVAAALAQRLENAGREPLLVRLGSSEDTAAAADARFFGALGFGVGDTPLGVTQAASMLGELGEALIVAEVSADVDPAPIAEKLDAAAISAGPPGPAAEGSLAGRYKGQVTFGRDADGSSLAVIGEDPILMAPTVLEVLQALPATATVRFLDGNDREICESVLIAPISHDTGRIYFNTAGKAVVVCRDDKPELALSALAGNTALLVITGGDEPLGYVAERAAAAGIPLAITPEGTVPTARRIEATFSPRPIRHARQVQRAAELLAGVDLDALLA